MSARRGLILTALTAAIMAISATPAAACSCVPLSPESVEEADAAAIATLQDVRPLADGRRGVFTYRLRRVLEGRRRLDGDRLRVRSTLDSASCGLPQDRRRYGLVLSRSPGGGGRWSASLCSVTTPEALVALTQGERPERRARPYCWGMRR